MASQTSALFDFKKLKQLGGLKAGEMLAVDPELYKKFMIHIGQKVKKDPLTSNLVFLTGLSAYTSEPINLFLRGDSSIGKTYNATQVLKYFPKSDVWLLGGLSPTALVHDRGLLVDKDGEPILPIDKPESDATPDEKQVYQAYQERMKDSHYLVDLTGKILVFLEPPNIETFNKLRPILSHDAEEISYKFTDKTGRGQLRAMHVVIRGWPATVFCSTSEKFIQDLATRSFTVTPETTEEKYKSANLLTGDKASLPWKFEADFDFRELESYIRTLRNQLQELHCVIPFAKKFADSFPSKSARSMRDFKHLLGLCQVFALFHYAQRPVLKRTTKTEIADKTLGVPEFEEETESYILATLQDYKNVIALWEKARETTETSAAGHIMTFYHEVVEAISKIKSDFSVSELTDYWNAKFSERKSSDTIRKWVDFLCDVSYLTKEPDPADKRQNRLKIIRSETNGIYPQSDFSAFFTLDSFKAWLNEAGSITAESQILLIENQISELEATPEAIFDKCFLCKNGDSAVIVLSDSEASSDKSDTKKAEENQSVHFPNLSVSDVLKLERLGPGFEDKCLRCGIYGKMDWQVTKHDESWDLLCGPCGDKLSKELGQ